MFRKVLLVTLGVMVVAACGALFLFASGDKEKGEEQLEIVMVAKHEGISWFDDMRVGVEQFGKDYGVNAYQIAPEGGDPAKQVQMTEDLIAKGVDAIAVVPNDPLSMVPVLKKAKEAGIVTVSHEAQQLEGIVDWDMESFVNEDFGRLMFSALAEAMNYEGQYTGCVGALTMETHMQWWNAGVKLQKQKWPKMQLVTDGPIEDKNDEKLAYDKVVEILKTYPDLKGIYGCTVATCAMGALALEERGIEDVKVAGLGLPSVNGPYLKSGSLYRAHCWRPADAGYVSCLIAYKVLMGEEIADGVNLVKSGYENCNVEGGIVFGNAPLVLSADNVDDYPF
jgi:simple sugar transport system substrate-binding protein